MKYSCLFVFHFDIDVTFFVLFGLVWFAGDGESSNTTASGSRSLSNSIHETFNHGTHQGSHGQGTTARSNSRGNSNNNLTALGLLSPGW